MNRPFYYTLKKGKVAPELNIEKWVKWFNENAENRVLQRTPANRHTVVTIFLGIDYGSSSRPILFESSVFDNHNEIIFVKRCSTYAKALRNHVEIVNNLLTGKCI